jgi:hypothetical protein
MGTNDVGNSNDWNGDTESAGRVEEVEREK